MNIDGLGPANMKLLTDKNLVHSAADLYTLSHDDLISLERFADKSADNLIKAIANSKNNQLDRLVFGLGIRNIGQRAAVLLCEKFHSMDALLSAEKSDIASIDGFGDVMAGVQQAERHRLVEPGRALSELPKLQLAVLVADGEHNAADAEHHNNPLIHT